MQKDEFRGSGKDYENNADGLDKWITQIVGGESSNKIVPQKQFPQKSIPLSQKNVPFGTKEKRSFSNEKQPNSIATGTASLPVAVPQARNNIQRGPQVGQQQRSNKPYPPQNNRRHDNNRRPYPQAIAAAAARSHPLVKNPVTAPKAIPAMRNNPAAIKAMYSTGTQDNKTVVQKKFSGKDKPIAPVVLPKRNTSNKLRAIPLGGVEEVGKNSMVFEYGDDIIAIDMGLQFPDEDMFGIDYIIPDTTYLEQRRQYVRGIIITHGHLDHIGALGYVLPKLGFPPVYATKLTLGLIKKQLEEFDLLKKADLREITTDSILKLGNFQAKFFRTNHSIPDGVAVVLKCPAASIVYTGDFKFDANPADDKPAEINKMKALGNAFGDEKISALFSDSTNARVPGKTVSERVIALSLDKLIEQTQGRVIIAAFSSLIGRIQQIIRSAHKHGRYVGISGRSMENNINIARELGYIKVPQGLIKPIAEIAKLPPNKVLIITTGSQGEAMSALTRMSINDHKSVKITKGDTVVISANPIIGNEKAVATVINNLCKLGADIVNNDIMDVHTSGHGCQDDLEYMIRLINPNVLIPVHGDLYMRTGHSHIGKKCGLKPENIILFEGNGGVLEIDHSGAKVKDEKVPSNYIVVDGLGTGDVGSQVLLDREAMAKNGILVVVFRVQKKSKQLLEKPLILTRGFVYMNESDEVIKKMKLEAEKAYTHIVSKDPKANTWDVCNYVKRVLDGVAHKRLARRPLVVPWIVGI